MAGDRGDDVQVEQFQQPGDETYGEPDLGVMASWDFACHARREGCDLPRRGPVETLQANLGRRCNLACQHCHVGAGPHRTESMPGAVARAVLRLLEASPSARVLDLTGGAPELNSSFKWMVRRARELGREVIVRSNLTVLLEPECAGLSPFLAAHQAHVVASLPCNEAENVDAQRGRGTFQRSIQALRELNALGYGDPRTGLVLDLVYNPGGAFLPPPQQKLQASYQQQLGQRYGIEFNRLLTLANLPISRFGGRLARSGDLAAYMQLLVRSFNPCTLPEVMCRSLVSVRHDGRLFDCDFNQMLQLPIGAGLSLGIGSVGDLDSLEQLEGESVATSGHCFGCTAGAGSSCGGALDELRGSQ